jgi:hypothetical protein
MRGLLAGTLFVALAVPSIAQHHGAPPAARPAGMPVRGPLAGVSLAPTPAFAPDGRLLLAFAEGHNIFVASSTDAGATFADATRVTRVPEPIDANGESRPKIAVGPGGRIYVTWTRKGRTMHIGDVRFARSGGPGRAFEAPVTLNDDGLEGTHRFDSLAVDAQGRVRVAWVDTRDRERARANGGAPVEAALYLAESRDGGRHFVPNRRIDAGVCECCRVALRVEPSGTPVVLWRDLLPGGVRDHSLLRLAGPAPEVRRASVDDWAINACPHHGPALAIARAGVYHAAWFSAGARQDGVFYARSEDEGRTWSPSMKIGSSETSGHADVLAAGDAVWLAWKESRPAGGTAILTRRSADGGRTWTAAGEAASTLGGSDHPVLVAKGDAAYLSWFTAREGYRLVALP